MKVYFSRREPFFVVTDNSDHAGFDAYPCEIPARTVFRVDGIQWVLREMKDAFDRNPAPEECVQAEADLLTELLDKIWEDNSGKE